MKVEALSESATVRRALERRGLPVGDDAKVNVARLREAVARENGERTARLCLVCWNVSTLEDEACPFCGEGF